MVLINIKENIKMEINMVMVNIFGMMDVYMKETMKMINDMAKAITLQLMGDVMMDFGPTT